MAGREAIRIEELNGLDAVRALAPAWNDLEHRSDARIPALHPEYVALWMDRLGRQATPRVLAAWDGDQLIGYAPFMETTDPFGPISARALKFIGNNIGFPGDILYADIMVCRDRPAAVPAILHHARSAWNIAKWDLGFLASVSPTLRSATGFLRLSEEEAASLTSEPFVFIELPTSWPDFLSTHPRAKENFRRRLRKLEKIGKVRLSTEEEPGQVARRTAELLANHRKWWGASFKDGWFGDAQVHGFMIEAARLLASQGRYLTFALELDGEAISWTTGALDGGQYTGYQRSYNRGYASYSPGTLLDLFVVRYLLSKGVSRIQLGPGLGDHKRVLGARTSTYVQVRGYRGWRRYAVRIARRWRERSNSSRTLGRVASA